MDTIIVIEAQDRNSFQQLLQNHVNLGYVIVHCNSFFRPAIELRDGRKVDTGIQYTAVLQLKIVG